jgi:hypothetical protein
MKRSMIYVLFVTLIAFSIPNSAFGRDFISLKYPSPDRTLAIKLLPLGSNHGEKSINVDDLWDCELQVFDKEGQKRFAYLLTRESSDPARFYDAGSRGGNYQGNGLRYGAWSSNSKYFVFTIYALNGDGSGQWPVLVYSRDNNTVFNLNRSLERVYDPNFSFVNDEVIRVKILDSSKPINYTTRELPLKTLDINITDQIQNRKERSNDHSEETSSGVDPEVLKIPGNISTIVSSPFYRLILVEGGFDVIQHKAFLQWLKEPSGEQNEIKVTRTAEVKELNSGKWRLFDPKFENPHEVTLDAYFRFSNCSHAVTISLRKDGTYSFSGDLTLKDDEVWNK